MNNSSTKIQLDMFSVDGNIVTESRQIQNIPIEQLFPHPDNPRLIYRQEIVDTIASSIAESGFRPEYALLVRPIENGFQIISGHTRHKAAQQAGAKILPCWVKELDDEAAFMELVLANNQGELSPLEYGMHVLKYVELSEGGRGKKGGLSEYARVVGKSDNTLRPYRDAANVVKVLNFTDVRGVLDKANHLAAIHKAPEAEWQQLVELLIERDWSLKQTEAIVDAVKQIDIPDILHGFLNPEEWIKKVIADAISKTPKGLQSKVMLWVNSAMENLSTLSVEQGVWQFDDEGNPSNVVVNLQERLLQKLPELTNGDQQPSQKKINELTQEISTWVKDSNDKYDKWFLARFSKEEADRQAREEQERINALKIKYAPVGINNDILNVSFESLGSRMFDAIVTDPPYLLSNDGFTLRSGKESSVNKNFEDSEGQAIDPETWIPLVSQWLRPGGVIVSTCTLHIYHRMICAANKAGLHTEREQAIWLKPNSPPQLSPTLLQADFEYIFLAFKPGGDSYFGAKEYNSRYEKYPSRTFTIAQCSGSERLGWHDTQKPVELYEKLVTLYVPKDGLLLDPFAGSGTTAVAAKRLNRIAYWVEKDSTFFAKAEHRIEIEPFNI